MRIEEEDERMLSGILDGLLPDGGCMEARMKLYDYLFGLLDDAATSLWARHNRAGTPRGLYDVSFKAGMEMAVFDLEGRTADDLAECASMRSNYDRLLERCGDPGKALEALYLMVDDMQEGDIMEEGEQDGEIWLYQYVHSLVTGKEIPIWNMNT